MRWLIYVNDQQVMGRVRCGVPGDEKALVQLTFYGRSLGFRARRATSRRPGGTIRFHQPCSYLIGRYGCCSGHNTFEGYDPRGSTSTRAAGGLAGQGGPYLFPLLAFYWTRRTQHANGSPSRFSWHGSPENTRKSNSTAMTETTSSYN